MTPKNRFVKAVEILFSNEVGSGVANKEQKHKNFFAQVDDNNENRNFKELQVTINNLSSKIEFLTGKINEFNELIVNLTTLNEELLYVLDQSFPNEEDNETLTSLHSKTKKCELN